ncbi:hypothetical protein [Longimicrobium sp.]|uniref:hypothetical protein n=1 Tax=Longimicrobium sp. TaxID=2029185 RepID=UPI002E2FF1E7|nr:hypothetical protein [Longimicrobium sp.]HEX6038037.1 hypothetical protein [Longimicrobium sp.]
MAKPLFLVENLFSEVQFPHHVVEASTEAPRCEAWRVATGRRSPYDRWTPALDNAESWIQVDCGAARTADMVAIDRGHTLAGRLIHLEHSADAAAWTAAFTGILPAATAQATAAAGAMTPEGAWLKRFAGAAARYWRLRVPAMGAGRRPVVVGLWVGRSWAAEEYLDLPYGPASRDLAFGERVSDAGWVGVSPITRARGGELHIRLGGPADEAEARYHIEEHFWRRRPMWILHDGDRADGAVLGVPLPGRVGFETREGWSRGQADVAWTEHEPVLD